LLFKLSKSVHHSVSMKSDATGRIGATPQVAVCADVCIIIRSVFEKKGACQV
jgi:hypothetical protein